MAAVDRVWMMNAIVGCTGEALWQRSDFVASERLFRIQRSSTAGVVG
jgi:hypothetical protein